MNRIIERFYTAFENLDAETMVECYHPDVVFEDPAFGQLKGERAKNMWRMLCASQKGKDFVVTNSYVKAKGEMGVAHWEAKYTFSQTQKKIHNIIEAEFHFKDGLIIKHTDYFHLYGWARQAFGLKGLLIGWTGFFKKKLQAQTNRMLDKFEEKRRVSKE